MGAGSLKQKQERWIATQQSQASLIIPNGDLTHQED